MTNLPEKFTDETQLEEFLCTPSPALIDMIRRLDGDIMILGVAGKMGVTMGILAANAVEFAGVEKKIYGAARFSDESARSKLEDHGVKTIVCDLMDQKAVQQLPQVKNIIFMAGRKFGTQGSEDITWAMNVLAPAYAAEHFKRSRIVAFSTGCVYPLVSAAEGGCTEAVRPDPVGEYSQSCLGRERIFEYAARNNHTALLLFRLNYSIDLRYGVLHDIAMNVWKGEKVNNAVSHFNAIWQGSANEAALLAIEQASYPVNILNVTGPETFSTTAAADEFGRLFGKKVEYMYPESGQRCYLNNAEKMFGLFGKPAVTMEQMVRWQADWIMNGGRSINKPTHFEVNNGKF